MPELKERVDRLEEAMMRLVYIQQKTEMEIQALKQEMKEFKDEMLEFKNEMKDFKDEMKEFKDEMLEFKNEMKDFKDEMKDFKDEMKEFKDEMLEFKNEMKDFKDEMKREVRRINKQWGELSNKLGTIVEDIVLPATRPIIKKYFKCDPDTLMANVEKKLNGKTEEWDVIAICKDKLFLVEVKATPRVEYIKQAKEKATKLKEFFPEYKDKEIILIFASLSIKEDILNKLTKEGIYAMAYREWEYMDILNFEEVKKISLEN
ncbi:hypothetical protein [Hydrogenothermus marinus]|uniref:DUF3782 domain-containing protein n=1 Tax=Hydrogenothermus marinus TaxID=133270 RepID=A0A3M0B7A9_9AQUI|nr:hypothetical protein [Hydrogenothermus marinus]RMA93300.1 hypothetical protein CLV39_1362 [Hydrogenothermus marinus]